MAGENYIKLKVLTLMTLHLLLDTVYPNLDIPQEISMLIQSWTGTLPGEFGNIKKGVSFLNSILEEVVKEKNTIIGYKGIHIEEEEFMYFPFKTKDRGSFESPIITIQNKYAKEYLYNTLTKTWAVPTTETEYSYYFLTYLTIGTQIIQNIVEKINAFVYERKETPLNLCFQQVVKRREIYDDRSNRYPMGPWSLDRIKNRNLSNLSDPGGISSFRITVDKSAVCPIWSLECFMEKDFHPWYILQQKAKAQNPFSNIY